MDKTDIYRPQLLVALPARHDSPASRIIPRGVLSASLLAYMGAAASSEAAQSSAPKSRTALLDRARECVGDQADVMANDDMQLALFLLYSLAYGSFDQWGSEWEWDPTLIRVRATLEQALEAHLRNHVATPALPAPVAGEVAQALFDLTAPGPGPSQSRFVATKASLDQLKETIVLRTLYTLREADPHSWAIPRVTGRAKAALVEIQSDEYGGGDVDRMHAHMFATTVRALDLDTTYGVYLERIPAIVLASHNAMSMFGLNRRLRGAIVGHLAAYEMTSTLPCRNYANGMRRLGLGEDATAYFDEHVAADAVHEQIAGRDLAGSLAEDEPALLGDIFLGAATHLYAEGLVEAHVLAAWALGDSSLRDPSKVEQAA